MSECSWGDCYQQKSIMVSPEKDYEKYWKAQLADTEKENELIIKDFRLYLKNENVSESQIKKHVSNIFVFIFDYLLNYELKRPKEGAGNLYFFFEWYAQNETLTPTQKNSFLDSYKQFYAYLHYIGEIDDDDLDEVIEDAKEASAYF